LLATQHADNKEQQLARHKDHTAKDGKMITTTRMHQRGSKRQFTAYRQVSLMTGSLTNMLALTMMTFALVVPSAAGWTMQPHRTRMHTRNLHSSTVSPGVFSRSSLLLSSSATDDTNDSANDATDPLLLKQVASQFTIITCSSTSCAKIRKENRLDEYATFSAFWERINESNNDIYSSISVQEGPCLGACKQAPCVAIEHEEYEGSVALLGMRPGEFSDRVFHQVVTEEDVDRVWECVQNAVQTMAESTGDDDNDDDVGDGEDYEQEADFDDDMEEDEYYEYEIDAQESTGDLSSAAVDDNDDADDDADGMDAVQTASGVYI
jgi:(2Fe-2S) ferredoxin